MSDLSELKNIVDDTTTVVTIPTPEGWQCKRPNCKIDVLHEHTTYAALTPQFVFYRHNAASAHDTPPTRLTEKEVRMYLATAGRKRIDTDVAKLKAGGSIFTRYGTYSAEPI